jgi:hypothetical protein
MTDEEMLRDGETPQQPVAAEEPTGADAGLVIIPGGPDPEEADDDVAPSDAEVPAVEDAPEVPDVAIHEAGADEPAETLPEPAPEWPQFTLDELVAEMAGVSAVTAASAPSVAEAVTVAPERVDVLAEAMSETFAEAPDVEAEMWTRAPFWALAAVWAAFAGALAYLLWPTAADGLQALMGASLYGLLVYGGPGLVVVGLVMGLIVRSRAQARASVVDRGVVGRAILLRTLGWTAAGVAVWVVAMIVVNFHAVGVIR